MPERQVITALTGTAAPLLTVNAANPRELDYGSFWLPREWKKCCPFVCDFQRLDANGQSSLDVEMNFELPKICNCVNDLIIEANFPSNTVTPLGATISYSDWTGFALMDYFSIHFGANQVYFRRPLDLYLRVRKQLGIERLESIRQQVYGDRTTAQRTALFQNGTGHSPLLIPVYLPFSDDPMMSLPILCLSQKTRFVFRTKPLVNFIQNIVPGGATFVTNGMYDFHLLCNVIHTTGSEGEHLLNLSRQASGIAYMIHQNARQEDSDYASEVTNFEIKQQLSGITKPLVSLSWMLIPTRLVNNSGFNNYFFFNPAPPLPIPFGMNPYSPILTWEIIANGLVIQRRIRRTYTTYHIYDMYDKGFAGEDIYTQNYSQWPHSVNTAMGYLDYTNLNNATLNITLGVGGTGVDPIVPTMAQQLRLIINALDYNFWFFKGGNWTRTFN
jgi:hypothetical protein